METISQTGHMREYAILSLIAAMIVLAQIAAFDFYRTHYDGSTATVNPASNGGSKTGRSNSTGGRPYLSIGTLVNYGNTTSRWYNYTTIPFGWNFYNLTVFLANGNVVSQYYADPSLQEHLVLSINGVKQNATFYWSLWVFCGNDHAWTYSKVGADGIRLVNGDVLSWFFTSSNSSPVQGAPTVASCST